MSKFEIRVEGTFEYSHTDGPFTEEELQKFWPEYLINYDPTFTLFLFDSHGNVVRQESGGAKDAMLRDWVTLDEWNTRAEADAYKGPDMSAAAKHFGGLLEPKRP